MNSVYTVKIKAHRYTWLSIFSVIFLILLWEFSIQARWVTSPFIVSPSTITVALIHSVIEGELITDVWVTLIRMFSGFLIGTVLGLICGLVMGWSKVVRAVLNPVIEAVYPLPKIALLPLIVLLVGLGDQPIIMIVALGAFFPVAINCIAGVASLNQIYFYVAHNYRIGKLKTFTTLILPGSMPIAFAGIRLALGMALLLTVIVEMSIASKGIGALLWLSWQTLRVANIYVTIAVIAVLSLMLNYLLNLIGSRIIRWQPE